MSARLRLLLALLLPFATAALQWALWDPWIKPYVWFLFFPAAFFSAWLGGMVGGVASTVTSALLAWYFFIPPQHSFAMEGPFTGAAIVMFIVMGFLFAWVHERLHRALHSSEHRFDATFEQAAVGIALVAPDGRWLRVNRKLCAIVGYSPSELLARTFQDITHPEDLATDLAQVQRMLRREIDTYTLEKRYLHKDGRVIWVNVTVALVWTAQGVPDYFISVVEDVTARKQAERRFAQLFELAPVALATSNRAGLVQLMNRAFLELFGYRPEDTPTLDAWRQRVLTDSDLRSTEADWTAQWLIDGQATELTEHRALCHNGEHKTVLLSRVRLGEEMMLMAIDITERKREQEHMQEHIDTLVRFHHASVGRELDMIALKREVNALTQELGRSPPYALGFADSTIGH